MVNKHLQELGEQQANKEFAEADQSARRGQGLARDLGDKKHEIEWLKWQGENHSVAGQQHNPIGNQ